MYAFRKPFTAATYDNLFIAGLHAKDVYVIAQLLGYTISKFIGIKVVSELKRQKRGLHIVVLIMLAAVALLLFGCIPFPLNVICIFLNGIPLGMIWGVVFSYLEGRRSTEMMGAVMAVSFIFSSGVVKSVGKWLLNNGVSEWWMPFLTGLLFFLPMLFFIWLLEQIPDPSAQDVAMRTERKPMLKSERIAFVKEYFPGLLMVVLAYIMLTVIRDFRDNFAADVWKELGETGSAVFTTTEVPVSIAVLVMISLLMLIKDNRKAFLLNHLVVITGFFIAGFSSLLFFNGSLNAYWWMVLNGLGLYLGYVPFNVMFFERKIAAIRKPANVGFLMYMADSFGYLGSMVILLFKNFGNDGLSYLHFFTKALYFTSCAGVVLMLLSIIYFNRKITIRL